jgi:type II restriction enzyme
MTIEDLKRFYERKKTQYGENAYQQISKILAAAKEQHKVDFLQSKAAQQARSRGREPDHDQSWRAFKGKNLEKLIEYIITDEIQKLGLKVVNGSSLERYAGSGLTEELSKLKRNLLVDYGSYGSHLPDVDLVIYEPKISKVIAILSSKVTLRERVAQTSYWKLKLISDVVTKHIKVYFITLDEDGTLTVKEPTKKGRAIVEIDTDGCYILSETKVEESEKVKMFDQFIPDLKILIGKRK